MQKELDKWSSWLTSRRYANNKQLATQATSRLEQIRDKVIRNAAIVESDKVLDIGTGDGLIAFEALKLIGETGKVYFTDISSDALELCKKQLDMPNAHGRFDLIVQSADDLNAFPSGSINVLTCRAVIMYVQDKKRCFDEFYRVLAPEGRISIFEPINQFSAKRNDNFLGLDFTQLAPTIAETILHSFRYPQDFIGDTMLNFNEYDLFAFAEEAGFREIRLECHALRTLRVSRRSWEDFLNSSPNPIDPPMKDILNSLGKEERESAVLFLQQAWEKPVRPAYSAEVYLTAIKS